jgi:hypothetical protein
MKRMMNEQALKVSKWWSVIAEVRPNLQADDGEDDAEDGGEDIGNTEGKAQDHAHHAGPKRALSDLCFPRNWTRGRYPKPSMGTRDPSDTSPQCLYSA